ncbi:Uncharacterized protein YwqG [Nannocystis exedens]|uniref:Uncharacterized protein YwqG n=1 Tax=Nannocystis exedens TaxID=54 RepID=A0A1I2H5F1_9BACT|nr:DUF1963 domain-containing protein [Nannocystis exedens]PCC75836.1 hypothetical protein NAEX_08949 [Nannocystis exedens]SFF25404.1 Uncharacterized protein YwqG [Nannocystis exedens]
MSVDADRLLALFRRHLPLRAGSTELAFASGRDMPVWRNEGGFPIVAVRLTMFDPVDGVIPLDIREQEVCLGDDREHAPERWLAYVEGHLRAMPAILAHFGDGAALLPYDLFAYGAVLADAELQRPEDFAAALSDPARLAVMDEAARAAEWRERLEPLGLAEHVAAVRAMARPSIRLHLSRSHEVDDDARSEAEATSYPGQTRLGGAPDLPPDLPWPEVDGVPLTFVAQFDLAELAGRAAARELPAHGLLSFFYAPIPPDGARAHPVRVLHFTDLDALVRRPVPADVEPLAAYDIDAADELQYPCVDSYFFYESLLPEERILAVHRRRQQGKGGELIPFDRLEGFIAESDELRDYERPFHRLLGHPASIQGDPYLDVEIDTRPQGWDGWVDGTPEALELRRRALRWRLLLQIDAQEDDGLLLNQDGGFFYFWIPADALAVHDWSQARGALQCH